MFAPAARIVGFAVVAPLPTGEGGSVRLRIVAGCLLALVILPVRPWSAELFHTAVKQIVSRDESSPTLRRRILSTDGREVIEPSHVGDGNYGSQVERNAAISAVPFGDHALLEQPASELAGVDAASGDVDEGLEGARTSTGAALAGELFWGLSLGLGAALLVQMAQMAAGMFTVSLLAVRSPAAGLEPPWEQLYRLAGWTALFLIGGHRLVVGALLHGPPAHDVAPAELSVGAVGTYLAFFEAAFAAAWRIALPMVLSQWTAQLTILAVGRIVPWFADWGIAASAIAATFLLALLVTWQPVTDHLASRMHQQVTLQIERLRLPWMPSLPEKSDSHPSAPLGADASAP